ncbi:hypothetical protein ACW9HQ_46660 [Nocardia gipuzkoensis]
MVTSRSYACVLLDLAKTGRPGCSFLYGIIVGMVAMILPYFAGKHGMALWQMLSALAAAIAACGLGAAMVWSRQLIYRMDRRVAEVMGTPLMEVMFDLDGRSRARLRGPVGIFVKLSMPSTAQRAQRLASYGSSSAATS